MKRILEKVFDIPKSCKPSLCPSCLLVAGVAFATKNDSIKDLPERTFEMRVVVIDLSRTSDAANESDYKSCAS